MRIEHIEDRFDNSHFNSLSLISKNRNLLNPLYCESCKVLYSMILLDMTLSPLLDPY